MFPLCRFNNFNNNNIRDLFTAPAHNRNLRGHHYKLFVKQAFEIFFNMRLLPMWKILSSYFYLRY